MRDRRGRTAPLEPAPSQLPVPPPPPPDAGEARRGGLLRSPWVAGAAAVLVLAAAIITVDLRVSRRPSVAARTVTSIADRRAAQAVADLQAQPSSAATVYDATRAGLVVVESQRRGGGPDTESLGSGIIIDTAGDVLTSLHVVDDAQTITTTFVDGTRSPASLTSSDRDHDIAVLTPDQPPSVIVPEVLGGGAQVGDEAFVVGHPLGLVASLSAGVISGLDREFPLADGRTLSGMIQFDAAVNPGSSGGPLFNRKGQVIGIVTGLANPVGDHDFVGIGFAVPIATAGGAAGIPPR